jgi:flagellar basal body-associated protein FliL
MGAIFWIVVVLVATTLGVVAYGYWLLSHLSFHLVKKADTVAQHDDVHEPAPRVPPRLVYDRQDDKFDTGWHRGPPR